jgi:hypothetical protein
VAVVVQVLLVLRELLRNLALAVLERFFHQQDRITEAAAVVVNPQVALPQAQEAQAGAGTAGLRGTVQLAQQILAVVVAAAEIV